ncbi:MAG: hypothetical protein J6T70_14080 [Bacteroidales bacterium]|nr:hypothetical protein [Bacteroidales bacterium]
MEKTSAMILTLLLSSFLLSCGIQSEIIGAKRSSMSDFGGKIKLHGQILSMDSVWKPDRIYCNDSLIFLVDKTTENFVHVFDSKTEKYKTSNIRLGNGPNESLSCFKLQIGREYVYSLDVVARKLRRYLYADFVTKSNVVADKEYEFDGVPFSVAANSKNEIIASILYNKEDESTLLTKYDENGIRQNVEIEYPVDNETRSNKYLFQNNIFYNEKQKKVVVTYIYADIFDVYDNSLNLLSRAQSPESFLPTMTNNGQVYVSNSETKLSFETCSLTSDGIWLLYIGTTVDKDDDSDGLYKQIFEYDYEGNPLHYYELDIPVFWFCVNETERSIYGLSDCPERSIVKFKY